MGDDLQVRLGLWPGFGQQPDAAPEPALEEQPPEPVDAVPDYAYGAARPAPGVAMYESWRLGWCAQVAWGNSAVVGVFHPGAVGPGQQGGHSQHQPVAGDTGRVGAAGLVPLPTQALDGLEPQLDPEAQRVPTYPNLVRRKVSQDDQGSSCSTYQTASRVQRRLAAVLLKAVPWPIQAVSGRGTKARAGSLRPRRPPVARTALCFPSRYGLDCPRRRLQHPHRQTPLHPVGGLVRGTGGALIILTDLPREDAGPSWYALASGSNWASRPSKAWAGSGTRPEGPIRRGSPATGWCVVGGDAAGPGLWHQGGRRP